MLNPARVDAAVDLAYGILILLAIVLIATLDFGVGMAFGVGVFAAYLVHVVWKMARYDPEWMTRTVEEVLDESVEEQIESTVGEQLESVESQVAAVDERLERRPREDQVAEIIEESLDRQDDE